MLVDYSDSDDDEAAAPAVASPAPPTPATAALLPPPHAIAEPPAKKVRKEINLQHLLQRQGVALPFEDAKNLPDDFFDIAPTREEDAGDKPTATRGWAALSSMLPAPKNAGKKSSSLSNSCTLSYCRQPSALSSRNPPRAVRSVRERQAIESSAYGKRRKAIKHATGAYGTSITPDTRRRRANRGGTLHLLPSCILQCRGCRRWQRRGQ
mmetsp:Transcript_77785/g.154538  ORF Transcript_77785/g.154538 Transcript_77785/m.154538 type:complete len:209 (-) Transcript_77785:982-1608(-)